MRGNGQMRMLNPGCERLFGCPVVHQVCVYDAAAVLRRLSAPLSPVGVSVRAMGASRRVQLGGVAAHAGIRRCAVLLGGRALAMAPPTSRKRLGAESALLGRPPNHAPAAQSALPVHPRYLCALPPPGLPGVVAVDHRHAAAAGQPHQQCRIAVDRLALLPTTHRLRGRPPPSDVRTSVPAILAAHSVRSAGNPMNERRAEVVCTVRIPICGSKYSRLLNTIRVVPAPSFRTGRASPGTPRPPLLVPDRGTAHSRLVITTKSRQDRPLHLPQSEHSPRAHRDVILVHGVRQPQGRLRQVGAAVSGGVRVCAAAPEPGGAGDGHDRRDHQVAVRRVGVRAGLPGQREPGCRGHFWWRCRSHVLYEPIAADVRGGRWGGQQRRRAVSFPGGEVSAASGRRQPAHTAQPVPEHVQRHRHAAPVLAVGTDDCMSRLAALAIHRVGGVPGVLRHRRRPALFRLHRDRPGHGRPHHRAAVSIFHRLPPGRDVHGGAVQDASGGRVGRQDPVDGVEQRGRAPEQAVAASVAQRHSDQGRADGHRKAELPAGRGGRPIQHVVCASDTGRRVGPRGRRTLLRAQFDDRPHHGAGAADRWRGGLSDRGGYVGAPAHQRARTGRCAVKRVQDTELGQSVASSRLISLSRRMLSSPQQACHHARHPERTALVWSSENPLFLHHRQVKARDEPDTDDGQEIPPLAHHTGGDNRAHFTDTAEESTGCGVGGGSGRDARRRRVRVGVPGGVAHGRRHRGGVAEHRSVSQSPGDGAGGADCFQSANAAHCGRTGAGAADVHPGALLARCAAAQYGAVRPRRCGIVLERGDRHGGRVGWRGIVERAADTGQSRVASGAAAVAVDVVPMIGKRP
eukprot:ctg_433.g266